MAPPKVPPTAAPMGIDKPKVSNAGTAPAKEPMTIPDAAPNAPPAEPKTTTPPDVATAYFLNSGCLTYLVSCCSLVSSSLDNRGVLSLLSRASNASFSCATGAAAGALGSG